MNKLVTAARRHWRPLLALNAAILAATAGILVFYPRTWTAQAQLILPNLTGRLNANLGPLGNFDNGNLTFSNELSPTAIQASILTSNAVLNRVWAADPERSEYSRDDYKKLFKTGMRDQSTIVSLEVKGDSPERARERASALIAVYQKRLNELRKDDARSREQFSKSELERAKVNLTSAQRAVSSYKRESGIVNSEEQIKGLVSALSTLTATEAQVRAQSRAAQTRAQVLASRLAMTPKQAIDSLKLGENKDYQIVREKLAQVETALAQARGLYTDKNARVKSLQLQREELLTALKKRITDTVPAAGAGLDTTLGGSNYRDGRIDLIVQLVAAESEASALTEQATQMQSPLSRLNASLSAMAVQQGRLLDLQRRYDIAEGLYKGLLAQVEQAKVSAFDSYPNVQSLDSPLVDPKPTSPQVPLVLLGALVGCTFGSAALALLLEGRNPLLASEDLERLALPVLARTPRLPNAALGGEIEVEFQRLATEVSLMQLENRRLMVTSSSFGEGKTTTVLGLALALQELGFRVLVVDGDFRRADLTRRLGTAPAQPGLELMATVPTEDRIGQYVARGQFETQIEAAQTAGGYDYVLIDSAPVSLTGEAALMAAAVGNVLFVVRPGTSDRDSVGDSLEQLQRHDARIVGLVVNGVQTRGEGYRYGRQLPAAT